MRISGKIRLVMARRVPLEGRAAPGALTEARVRALAGETSFVRGVAYFQDGAIRFPVRDGDRLRALCGGSRAEPYRVSARIRRRGEVDVDCTCPRGGFCKHAVALLLTWLLRPEAFAEVAERSADLRSRSKAELVALVEMMLQRAPELEDLLDLPLPVPDRAVDAAAVSAHHIRGRVEAALDAAADDGRGAPRALEEVRALVELAGRYRKGGSMGAACTVYRAVLEAGLPRVEGVDDEGEVAATLRDAVAGLRAMLRRADGGLRRDVVDTLYTAWIGDVDAGGFDIAADVPEVLMDQCTPEERAHVVALLRADLETRGQRRNSPWQQDERAELLLDLLGDTLDAEAHLAECRRFGLTDRLIEGFMNLGRHDDAVAAAETEGKEWRPRRQIQFADRLRQAGEAERAAEYVGRRLAEDFSADLATWLGEHHLERGEHPAALALFVRAFSRAASRTLYDNARTAAEAMGVWTQTRSELLTAIRNDGQLSVDILLAEGDVVGALAAAEPRPGPYFVRPETLARVAQAASESLPHEAVRLYRKLAEMAIAGRQRHTYQQAVRWLAAAGRVAASAGEAVEWRSYVRELLLRHRQLRALQDEARKGGLLQESER